MLNHWLKKHKQEKWMEDAIEIYHLSREKIPEIDLGTPQGFLDSESISEAFSFSPSSFGEYHQKSEIQDNDKGSPIFDSKDNNHRGWHPHNWIQLNAVCRPMGGKSKTIA